MPLPTPVTLSSSLTKLIAAHTGCSTTWAHHPQPMNAVEMMAVRKAIAQHMTKIAADYFQETSPK